MLHAAVDYQSKAKCTKEAYLEEGSKSKGPRARKEVNEENSPR